MTIQGDEGDEFFLLTQGQCEFAKTLIYDKSEKLRSINPLYGLKKTTKEEVVIANFEKGALIGDEILFGEREMHEYTVRIISETAQFASFKKTYFSLSVQS